VSAVAAAGGWLVARSTGESGGYSGIAVVRIEGDGRLAAAPGLDGLPGAPRATQPHLATDASGALLHYYAGYVVALSATGHPTGAPTTLPGRTGSVIAARGRDLAVATGDPLLHLVRGAAVVSLVAVPDAFGVAAAPFGDGIALAWAHASRAGPRLSLALLRP
jgi:hypothetical protein